MHDGRFHEQSVRIAAENAHIIHITDNSRGIPPGDRKKTSSAIATLAVHKDFYVMPHVPCPMSHAQRVCRADGGIDPGDLAQRPKSSRQMQWRDALSNNSAVVKAQKKANLTRQKIDRIMLKSVPGVSEKYAQVILASNLP